MKKIVILGCENSHANTFLNFIRDGLFPEVEVVGVYSDNNAAAQKLQDTFGVKVMKTFDEAVGEADGVVITARHGDSHYKFAAPYIDSGCVFFIDKPITIDEAEAVEFMKRLKEADIKVTGGSCIKFNEDVIRIKDYRLKEKDGKTLGGFMRAPISLKNNYGDFFFYSQHLVEPVCELFGHYPTSVQAFVNGDKVTADIRYLEYDVTALFVEENYYYAVARHSEKGIDYAELDISNCFHPEFAEFYNLLMGAEQKREYKDIIAPVFIMNAINRSINSGMEEKITEFDV